MGSESEQVLALLQELSVLKELDACETATQTECEQRLRQQRKQEIKEAIRALAEQKKNGPNFSVEAAGIAFDGGGTQAT
jgi:hypothetical protein